MTTSPHTHDALDQRVEALISGEWKKPATATVLIACSCIDAVHRDLAMTPHHVKTASSAQAAINAISDAAPDVIVIDCTWEPTDIQLISSTLSSAAPWAQLLAVAPGGESQATDGIIAAIRAGAVDILWMPGDAGLVANRVVAAITEARTQQQQQHQIKEWRSVCEALRSARQDATRRLDVMANDLVDAYKDIGTQVNQASIASEYKALISQDLDIESMLRTSLEYLMSRVGPSNALVLLAEEPQWTLGAYVNYDLNTTDLETTLSALTTAAGGGEIEPGRIVAFDSSAAFNEWAGEEALIADGSHGVVFECISSEGVEARILLLRSRTMPWDESIHRTLRTIAAIFAEQVVRIDRIHHRGCDEWPKGGYGDLAA